MRIRTSEIRSLAFGRWIDPTGDLPGVGPFIDPWGYQIEGSEFVL